MRSVLLVRAYVQVTNTHAKKDTSKIATAAHTALPEM